MENTSATMNKKRDHRVEEEDSVSKRLKNDAAVEATKLSIEDPRIWKPLAAGGYLASNDLGRLLLLTKKTWVEEDTNKDDDDGKEESVWKYLCWNEWGATTANSMLQATRMAPKSYFRTCVYPAATGIGLEPLPQPKYSPKDYALIVHVRAADGNHKLLFSRVVPGEAIPQFFASGNTDKISLDSPVVDHDKFNGTFSSYTDFYQSMATFRAPGWKASAHLLRLPDQKILQLMELSKYGSSYEFVGVPIDEKKRAEHDLVTERFDCQARCYVEIESLLCQHLDVDSYEPVLESTLDMCYKVKLSESGEATLEIHGFRLNFILWKRAVGTTINEKLTEKGIQFAQVLEALSNWKSST